LAFAARILSSSMFNPHKSDFDNDGAYRVSRMRMSALWRAWAGSKSAPPQNRSTPAQMVKIHGEKPRGS
jgi:hypothetical protein